MCGRVTISQRPAAPKACSAKAARRWALEEVEVADRLAADDDEFRAGEVDQRRDRGADHGRRVLERPDGDGVTAVRQLDDLADRQILAVRPGHLGDDRGRTGDRLDAAAAAARADPVG